MKRIKYIGFYNSVDNRNDERYVFLSAINKMDYIISALNDKGYLVDIVSTAWSKSRKNKFVKEKHIKLDNNNLILTPTFGAKIRFFKHVRGVIALLWLFIYLLKNTEKKESIIVYHSPILFFPIMAVKKIKKLNVILEVEEIYSKVYGTSKFLEYIEHRFIEGTNNHIVVSDVLKEYISKEQAIVLYGNYNTAFGRYNKLNDETRKVNLLFSGLIEDLKCGAKNAVLSMKYLPDNYHLHLSGYGNEQNIKNIKILIESVNKSSKKVTFHGTLSNEKYEKLLSKCDVGLNPQKVLDYTEMEFPSKILTYLSHNLRVVSTKGISLKKSRVAELLMFSNSDDPRDIAEAIKKIDLYSEYNGQEKVIELHKKFCEDLVSLIK